VKTIRYAYDPWGKRRYASGATDPGNALIGDYHGGAPDAVNGTDRGFTGHEHLDDLGVIHMNARLYDPLIGRFMQGDPVVGDPFDIQTYNAYSYVYNRPLNTVDADGKCPVCIGAIVGAIALHAMGIIDQQQMRMVVSIAVAAWLGPGAGPSSWPAAGQAAAAGFVSGAIATGNFKGAAQGAFTSLAFYGAGSLGDSLSSTAAASGETGQAAYWSEKGLGRTMLHAGVGCITSVTGGGKCGAGAALAGAAQFLGARLKAGDVAADTFIHAMIGGTASVLGGGKFANGAQSGAFGYLFNQSAHDDRPSQPGLPGPVVGDPKPIIELLSNIADRFSGPSYAESYRERALKAAGITEAEAQGLDVHHIVERNSNAAAPARVALAKVGIGVDDLENLMITSRADHKPLHTGQYITTVNAVMIASVSGGRPAVVFQLNLIKTSIYVKGTFP
jgi:RHS repeat-associated protein